MSDSKASLEELEAKNTELKIKLAKLQEVSGARGRTRARIMQAVKEVAHEKGHNLELRDVTKRISIGNSTFYKYFAGRNEAILELAMEMIDFTTRRALEVAVVRDPIEALRAWMRVGFDGVAEYGRLAVELCYPSLLPEWLAQLTPNERMYRFTGHLVKNAIEKGVFRPVSTRSAVRTWFALCHPSQMSACQADGLTLEKCRDVTVNTFILAYRRRDAD